METKYDFAGKTALVTGAGSGLGEAIAKGFAQAGANVIVADINEPNAQKVAEEINSYSKGKALSVKCNVTVSEDVQNAVKLAVDTFGKLDIGVNNAGSGIAPALTADVPENDFEWLIQLNLTSVFRCMKYELNQMLKQGNGGVILNMASALGITTIPMNTAYVTAKHGVVGLTKNAAVEYANQKIRINAICPGVINTPLILNSPKEATESSKALHPIGRFGEPEEVAAVALFLASSEASFVTGAAYTVDGGWTAS